MSDTKTRPTPRTGDGTKAELALATAAAREIAKTYSEDVSDFFVAGHEHEGLSRGSVSVAWEGHVDSWACTWPDTEQAREFGRKRGVWFEAINGCILAVHKL